MCSSVSGLKSVLAVILLLSIISLGASNVEAAFERYINNSDTYYTLGGTDIQTTTGDSGIYVGNVTNVTIDCNARIIRGDGVIDTYGIVLDHATSVTITGCHVVSFYNGIFYNNTHNSIMIDTVVARISAGSQNDSIGYFVGINGTNITLINNTIASNQTNNHVAINIMTTNGLHNLSRNNIQFNGTNITAINIENTFGNLYFYNNTINVTGTAINNIQGVNNTIIYNRIYASTWINNQGTADFNLSNAGNTYFFANGSGSWTFFDIKDYDGDGWAESGSSRPFNDTTVAGYWNGSGEDWFPGILDSSIPSVYYVQPTLGTDSHTSNTFLEINVSIIETNLVNVTMQIYNGSTLINVTNLSRVGPSYYLNFTGLNNSIYNYNVTVVDSYNRTNWTETRTITIDTITPQISFGSNSDNGGNVSRNYVFANVTGNDTNFGNLTIRIYNTTLVQVYNLTTSSGNGSSNIIMTLNFTTTEQGMYFYNATVYDLAGNVNHTTTRNITIDTVAPSLYYEGGTDADGLVTTRNYLIVNATSTSALINISVRTFFSNGTLYNYTTNSSNILLINLTLPYEGKYYYNITGVDLAGNYNYNSTRNISLDTTNPVPVINSPSNDFTFTVSNISINVSVMDSNFANMTIQIYNSTSVLKNETTTSANYVFYQNLSSGNYTFNLTVYDLAGNSNTTNLGTFNVNLDAAGPSITVISPSGYYNSTSIFFNITLNENGTAKYNINNGTNNTMNTTDNLIFTFTNNSISDGSYSVYFFANDSGNNLGTNSTTFVVDTINPSASYSTGSDANGLNTNRNNIILNFSITETNFKNITIRLYNGSGLINTTIHTNSANLTVNISVPYEGTFSYNATVYDQAGNYNETSTRTITTDTTTPSITINFPVSSYHNSTNITFNITVSEVSTAVISTQQNTNRSMSTSNNLTFTYLNSSIGNGTYNITFFATDASGNYNSSSILLTIDTTSPSISYIGITPANGSYHTSSYPWIEVSSSDGNFRNVSVKIYNSSGIIINYTTNNTPGVVLDSSYADGTYYYNATATDLAGNQNTTETRVIIIDTTYPNITINSPVQNSSINVSNVTINISLTEVIGMKNTTINLYNGTINGSHTLLNASFYTNETSIQYTIYNLPNGTYFINISAIDLANHLTTVNYWNFTINSSNTTESGGGGGSGGGSGGGGGGSGGSSGSSSSAQTTTPVESDEVTYSRVWFNLVEGNRTVTIAKEGVPVTEIVMDINYSNNSQAQVLQIKAAESNPTEEELNAEVYKFITIDADVAEGQYESISITFKIEDEWLANNSINKTNLTVYRFDEGSGKWMPISATLLSNQNSTNYTYYSVKIYATDLLAVGSPLLAEMKPVITQISRNETGNKSEKPIEAQPQETETEVIQASSESFMSRVGRSISNAYEDSKEYLLSIPKQTQTLLVLMISSMLLLLTLSVGGTLLYRKMNEGRQEKLWRRHYQKHGSITSYEQEPPLQNPPIKIGTPPAENVPEAPAAQAETPKEKASQKAKEKAERPLTTPELTVRKISQLLQQSEYSLDNGKAEDAKKQYLDAKTLYFDSGIGYEYKSKVYDKMMQLHNRIYK